MALRLVGLSWKVAVTVVLAETTTMQAAEPEQPPPDQPRKREPEAGEAERVTEVPAAKATAQVTPQAMPAGLLETVPVPVPTLAMVRVAVPGPEEVKVAVTVVLAETTTMQVPEPAQPP